METYTLPCVKQIASGNLLYDSGNANWGSVTTLEGQHGVGGRFKKEGTDVYLWLIHVDCKAIKLLQLKINDFFKKTLCPSDYIGPPRHSNPSADLIKQLSARISFYLCNKHSFAPRHSNLRTILFDNFST